MAIPLFDNLIEVAGLSLDYRLRRHALIAGNLANADTPGYTPVDLRFEEVLARVAEEGRDGASTGGGGGEPEVVADPVRTPGADGNSVDLDREMAKLQANVLLYQAGTRVLARKFALLSYAIHEGGR